jgi:tellurite resistance protein TerC
MAREHGPSFKPDENFAFRIVNRLIPVTSDYHGHRFFVREGAPGARRLAATPLFVVLVLVEATDLLFAVDSIPAVFAVTDDPFIVYSSNVFAILGLRALYFLLANVIDRFHYLKTGLAVVLVFVGLKMMAADLYKIPIAVSLGVIVLVLGASIAASELSASPAVPPLQRERPAARKPPAASR